ncbi:alpha/beta fold hydrolase [Actinomyces respiraculi]|uniref:Alpha/beta fold hydrolase n=1 Tax=Actinomyces respiraculi TaxID=2744574 RepID=A0A7T0LMF6_9ACTO|nr:alpha/beta fold hydrolase [Actinomyces respiraculi]
MARYVLGAPDAPTLVYLHGITSSAASSSEALEHWAAAGYRVIALDARGHGLSPRWSQEELSDAGAILTDDLLQALTDLAQESHARRSADLPVAAARPVVVGHSMGAATAMVAATRRPDLLGGVVLIDPARYGTRGPEELRARGAARARMRGRDLADLPAALARILSDDEVPETEAVAGVWAQQHTDPALLVTGVVAPEAEWEQAMATLAVPTLLVTGDRPGSARVGTEGLALLGRLGNPWIETALVPGAGHDVRRCDPQAFHRVVDPWLRRYLGA